MAVGQCEISRRIWKASLVTERELSQLPAHGRTEAVGIISMVVCLTMCCGLGQTALRSSGVQLRQCVQRGGDNSQLFLYCSSVISTTFSPVSVVTLPFLTKA